MLSHRITAAQLQQRHKDEVLLGVRLREVHVVAVIHFQGWYRQQPEIARLVGVRLGADLLALGLSRGIAGERVSQRVLRGCASCDKQHEKGQPKAQAHTD